MTPGLNRHKVGQLCRDHFIALLEEHMKRYFQYNGVVSIAFLAFFFGPEVLSIRLSDHVSWALFWVFLVAFYGASYFALRRDFRWAFFLSILSAVVWIFLVVFVDIEIYALIYGTEDLM